MRKLSIISNALIFFFSCSYAYAYWTDYGIWWGGPDLCKLVYSEQMCKPPAEGIDLQCFYYYQSNGCCCQGLVWVPDSPANVKVTVVANSIAIRWDKDPTVKSYSLWWGTNPVITLGSDNKFVFNTNSFTHRNLKYDTRYYYYLRANGEYGGSSTSFDTATGPEPVLPQIYLMKGGNLYGAIFDNFNLGTLKEIDSGGWAGDLEVSVKRLYLMKNGNLYGAKIVNFKLGSFQEIDSGGWTGDLAVSGNRLYLMKNGDLYSAVMDDFNLGSFHQIGSGGWTGDLEVYGNNLYLMKNGNLYGATIDSNFNLGPLNQISSGGWTGVLSVSKNMLCLMKNGNLYGAAINKFRVNALRLIDSGGWTGDMEINCF